MLQMIALVAIERAVAFAPLLANTDHQHGGAGGDDQARVLRGPRLNHPRAPCDPFRQ